MDIEQIYTSSNKERGVCANEFVVELYVLREKFDDFKGIEMIKKRGLTLLIVHSIRLKDKKRNGFGRWIPGICPKDSKSFRCGEAFL